MRRLIPSLFSQPRNCLSLAWLATALLAGVAVLCAPNTYWLYLLGLTAVYVIAGSGLNLLVGWSGQISLGHAGFFAVGAYVTAILGAHGVSFWLALPLAMLLPALLGALLAAPALRVKGPYLAMVTIAFGLVLQNVLIEAELLTGGFNGIGDIQKPLLSGLPLSLRAHVGVIVLSAGATLLLFACLGTSRFGKLLRAVRDSDIAARSIGLNPWRIKTAALVVSAAFAGLAGGLFAPLAGFISPESFDTTLSIQFLLLVILGGLETRAGPLIGAIAIAALPEALSGLAEYRLLFFGTLLLLLLAVMPNGIAGTLGALLAKKRAPNKPARASVMGTAQNLPMNMAINTAKSTAKSTAINTAPVTSSEYARGAERAAQWLSQARPMALAADMLGITFGGLKAVHDVCLVAEPGHVTGLIGPNGAGKTSLLNMLGGFYRPDAGQVTLSSALGNMILPAGRSEACARLGVGRTFQTTLLFDSLSVADNLRIAMKGDQPASRIGDLLALVGFHGDPELRAAELPFVDRRLVEIARALALQPKALLLDEPAAGLGKAEKAALAAMLGRIAACGVTVLLVEHDMPLVMQACSALVVMVNGQVLRAGSVDTVRNDPAVLAAYLGTGSALQRGARQKPGPVILASENLCAAYGQIAVLDNVSIDLREHELVAVVGANGAGKSTLMRALTGLLPASGKVWLKGAPALRLRRADRMARAGLVMVPEGRQVFPRLSVRDNLLLGGFTTAAALREQNLQLMLERFPRLAERLHQNAGLLSGGEQQMLALARGLMAMPALLILDEPSLGLAPQVVASVYQTIDQLVADGLSALLVDQFAAMALAIADRGYLLAQGQVVLEGTAEQLRSDPTIHHAYLGEHACAS